MRSFSPASLVLLVATLAGVPSARAQYGGSAPRPDRATRALLANAEPPRLPPTVAALVVLHGGDLQLTQSQLDVVESVRRSQDSANRPWMAKLDSLRNGPRPVNPADLSQDQRDDLAARHVAIAAATAAMRETNAEARQRVMAALNGDQQQKAAVLEDRAAKQAKEDGKRRGYDTYGGDRGDMGGRRRPRED